MKQNRLENLHWREFERLVVFYLKEKVGDGLSAFDGSRDEGRDAEFHGTANEFPSKSRPFKGDWIFQVKHRTTRTKTVAQVEQELLRSLLGELIKIFKKHRHRCDNYIYITNLNVSNNFRAEAAKSFDAFFNSTFAGKPKPNFRVIECKDLEPYVAKNLFVRRAFPSLLTFMDVENVFLKKEEVKNRGYIKTALSNMPRFVSTTHYLHSVNLLTNSHFLMLVGDPKSGKTTIVEALAVAFLEEGEFRPYFIRNADEFITVAAYLPKSDKALFICDDIFGQHELDSVKLADWTDYFRSVMGLVDERHRFVFTTRRYIYEEFARKSGLRSFFPDDNDPTRYVIKLKALVRNEREQILEKHVETSDLPSGVISLTLAAKEEIMQCEDFSPEVIRSLIGLLKSKMLSEVAATISNHIKHPNQYLYDLFDGIAIDKRLLLLSVAIAPTKNVSSVESRFLEVLKDCNVTPSVRFDTFIGELEGSIVRKMDYTDASEVEYYHPSMYDVIVAICGKDQHYRHLMLRHLNLELLWLLTIRKDSKKPNPIQMGAADFDELITGLQSLLSKEASLPDVAAVLQWISGSLSIDLPYSIAFVSLVSKVKNSVRSILGGKEFYHSHANETLDHWVGLFDKWQGISGNVILSYKEELSDLYKKNPVASYWRLMFAIESVNSGFVENYLDPNSLNSFIVRMAQKVAGLRVGLNINEEGRPKTSEGWLASFYIVQDLITKMKRSNFGKGLIETHLLSDWDIIKRYSDFARNRHAGMVKAGHWNTMPTLKTSSQLWDLILS